MTRVLHGNALHHRNEPRLRCAVALPRLLTEEGRATRDEHHRTTATPFDHVTHTFLRSEERSIEVDPHHAVPLIGSGLQKTRRLRPNAGIHVHTVDSPELGNRSLHRLHHLLLIANIADEVDDLVSVHLELGPCTLILGRARTPDRNIGAVRGEGVGHTESNATVSAGDQSDVSVEIEGAAGILGSAHLCDVSDIDDAGT